MTKAFRALTLMLLCRMQMSLVNSAGPDAAAPAADPCGAGADDGCTDPDFAQKLRIGAVFILLVSSTLGVWLPVIAGEPVNADKDHYIPCRFCIVAPPRLERCARTWFSLQHFLPLFITQYFAGKVSSVIYLHRSWQQQLQT